VAKNNKTHFFYVLYCDKTWVFDQSERAQGRIYIIKGPKTVVSAMCYEPDKTQLLNTITSTVSAKQM